MSDRINRMLKDEAGGRTLEAIMEAAVLGRSGRIRSARRKERLLLRDPSRKPMKSNSSALE